MHKCGKFCVQIFLHYIDIAIFALEYFLPHPVQFIILISVCCGGLVAGHFTTADFAIKTSLMSDSLRSVAARHASFVHDLLNKLCISSVG